MLLLKLNEFTLNHLILGLLLNFVLLKLLVVAYKKSGLALIRLLIYSAAALPQINTMLLLLKLSVHSMLLLFLLTLLILANFGLLSIKFFIVKFQILCPLALIVLFSLALLLIFSHLRFIKFILIFCLIHLELLLIYLALTLLQNLTSSCLLRLMRSQNLSMNPMTFAGILISFFPLFLRDVRKFALYLQLSPISSIFLLLLVFFLINLNPAQFILSLRNLTVIKMTCLIIDLFLICLSFLN